MILTLIKLDTKGSPSSPLQKQYIMLNKFLFLTMCILLSTCQSQIDSSLCSDISLKDLGCIDEPNNENIKFKYNFKKNKLVSIFILKNINNEIYVDTIEAFIDNGVNILYYDTGKTSTNGVLGSKHYLFVKNDTTYEYRLERIQSPEPEHNLFLSFTKTIQNETLSYGAEISKNDTSDILKNITSAKFQGKIQKIVFNHKRTFDKMNQFKLSNFL
jgi:hypothetical protein